MKVKNLVPVLPKETKKKESINFYAEVNKPVPPRVTKGLTVPKDSLPVVQAYTDGAWDKTSKKGGWGVFIQYGSKQIKRSGRRNNTTNQRMELLAAICALGMWQEPHYINLHTDSLYLMKGVTAWLKVWLRNGWCTAYGKPVKNKDFWQELAGLLEKHTVTWTWVKGHSGHLGNEIADRLATEALRGSKKARQ